MVKFLESLQELMNEKGLSRLQLAKAIDIAPSTIDGYFNLGWLPTLEIAIKLCDYFNCSLNFLLGLSDISQKMTKASSKSFFDVFETLRKENKYSIAKIFDDLKMGRSNYYRWKNGLIPKMQNIIEIAKYFDVTIDFLVGRQ